MTWWCLSSEKLIDLEAKGVLDLSSSLRALHSRSLKGQTEGKKLNIHKISKGTDRREEMEYT